MFAGIRIPVADTMMVLCAICGNKRCPHATNHEFACTNSNAPGQPGSSYENCKPSVALPKPSVAAQLSDPACEDIVTQFQKDCAAVTQALNSTTQYGDEVRRMAQELAHWKANHAHMVSRCAFLSERPDLPVDRIPAFTRMTNELARLKQELAIKDAALIAAGVNLADLIDAPQELKLEFSAVLPVDLCALQITTEPPTEINPVPGA